MGERFNRTFAERLFGYQSAKELQNHTIAIENGSRDYLRLSNKWGNQKVPPIKTRKNDTPVCPFANVRYLYQPGELGRGKTGNRSKGAQCLVLILFC